MMVLWYDSIDTTDFEAKDGFFFFFWSSSESLERGLVSLREMDFKSNECWKAKYEKCSKFLAKEKVLGSSLGLLEGKVE